MNDPYYYEIADLLLISGLALALGYFAGICHAERRAHREQERRQNIRRRNNHQQKKETTK
jgi:hypothetical protein